ncbi:tetratricopeptide repeat protein [Gemmatimonadota bacterium]
MSIIADALKKAQRKGKGGGDVPPPFDLGQGKGALPATPAGQAPRAKPVVVAPGTAVPKAQPAPRAQPVTKAQSTPKAQPSPRAAATKAAPAATPGAAGKSRKMPLLKQRRVRLIAMAVVILIVSATVIYYVNYIYVPGLEGGGITTTAARRQAPPANQSEQAAPGMAAEIQAESESGQNALAQTDAEQLEVPPVPEVEPAADGESGLIAGGLSADLPESPFGDLAVNQGEFSVLEPGFSGGDAPAVPPSQGTPGSIVHKGEQGKQLREDIYHFNMAVYFQRKGDIREALREYAEVIRLSPHNAEVFSNMGVLHNQTGEYEKAVSVLQKALLIDPRYSKARNNLAIAYYRMSQYDLALEQAGMAVELEPGNIDALSNMGLIYRKLDRADRAEQSFRKALAVDPGYSAAHYNLALLYEQTGQLALASRHYRSFLSGGGGSEQLNDKVRTRLQELSSTAVPSGN